MIMPGRAAASRILEKVFVGVVCLAAAATSACMLRPAAESLRKAVADLQQENFQLRKDLTEARVRLEMQKERGDQAPAGPGTAPLSGTGPTSPETGAPAAGGAAPRVI